jgi:hypothetical protein
MTAPSRGVTEPKGDRMSRTDNTRPRWVRLADTPMLTCEPVHDHRFGPCTLPDRPTPAREHGRCHWGATAYFHAFRTDDGGPEWNAIRRADRRRSRHQTRQALRTHRPALEE